VAKEEKSRCNTIPCLPLRTIADQHNPLRFLGQQNDPGFQIFLGARALCVIGEKFQLQLAPLPFLESDVLKGGVNAFAPL